MDYKYLYRKLNKRTPIKSDCGKLCNGRCCSEEECEDMGMYLFPEEEKMFLNEKGFRIEDSDFEVNGKKVKILFCDGKCDRRKRPLSCRIFPLFPYITPEGDLKIIKDSRAKGMCPLWYAEEKVFSHSFKRGLYHVGKILCEDCEYFDFLFELSRLIDEVSF